MVKMVCLLRLAVCVSAAMLGCACTGPLVRPHLSKPAEQPERSVGRYCESVTGDLEKRIAEGKSGYGEFQVRDVKPYGATVEHVYKRVTNADTCIVVTDAYPIEVGRDGDLRWQVAHQILAIVRQTQPVAFKWRLLLSGETIVVSTRVEDEERTESFLRSEMFGAR